MWKIWGEWYDVNEEREEEVEEDEEDTDGEKESEGDGEVEDDNDEDEESDSKFFHVSWAEFQVFLFHPITCLTDKDTFTLMQHITNKAFGSMNHVKLYLQQYCWSIRTWSPWFLA